MCKLNSEIEALNSSISRDKLLITLSQRNYNQKNHVRGYEYEDRGNSQMSNFM